MTIMELIIIAAFREVAMGIRPMKDLWLIIDALEAEIAAPGHGTPCPLCPCKSCQETEPGQGTIDQVQ